MLFYSCEIFYSEVLFYFIVVKGNSVDHILWMLLPVMAFCNLFVGHRQKQHIPRCIKLGGETDSAIRWRKITDVTSARGPEEASWEELSEISLKMSSGCCEFVCYNRKLCVHKPISIFSHLTVQMLIKTFAPWIHMISTKLNKWILLLVCS